MGWQRPVLYRLSRYEDALWKPRPVEEAAIDGGAYMRSPHRAAGVSPGC